MDKLGNGQPLLEFMKKPYEYVQQYHPDVDQTIPVPPGHTSHDDVLRLLTDSINRLNLDKPRFLQDQVFTKVLLRESELDVHPIDGLNTARVAAAPGVVAQLHANAQVAKTRYDTKLVRNLAFITQLQRIIRVQIRNKLQTINTRVISDAKILSEQYTEFSGTHQQYDDNEFTYNN